MPRYARIRYHREGASEGVLYEVEEFGTVLSVFQTEPRLLTSPGERDFDRECGAWARLSDGHILNMPRSQARDLLDVYRTCGDWRNVDRVKSLRPDL
jgi:hypothetical protein